MAKSKKAQKKVEVSPRDIIHPDLEVKKCVGERAITVALAKKLLGWQEVTDDNKGLAVYQAANGKEYPMPEPLLTDHQKNKIRCLNNISNRAFYMAKCLELVQEILQKRWRFNGEPIIIGKTGLILNGQHTLVALILAEQKRVCGPQKMHWEANWQGECTIEKLIVYGVDEADDTVNTMDTCKPRSLSDVIYRSEFFSKLNNAERKNVSRMADYCIRLLWHRTGADKDAFAPRRTNTEAPDFLLRHKHVSDALNHINIENVVRKDPEGNPLKPSISRFLSPGYASAVLYLMASSGTEEANGVAYRMATPAPSEKELDLKLWDKATEFWVLMSSQATNVLPVCRALNALTNPNTGAPGSLTEKLAVLAKAWAIFKQGYEITDDDLKLKYAKDEDGLRILDESPTFGGIDLGNPEKPSKKTPETSEAAPAEPDQPDAVPEDQEPEGDLDEQKAAARERIKQNILENRRKKDREREEANAAVVAALGVSGK